VGAVKLMDRDLKDFRRELQQAHFIVVLIFVAAVALITAAILGAL
jgi:hypothetical protein